MNNQQKLKSTRTDLFNPDNALHEKSLPAHQQDVILDVPVLPPVEASPGEVRQFLYNILRKQSPLDEAKARELSDKWTYGTGKELQDYPIAVYREIFGDQATWTIYPLIRKLILDPQQARKIRARRNRHIIFGTVTGTTLLALIACILCFLHFRTPATAACIIAGGILFLGASLAWIGFACSGGVKSVDSKVQGELASGFK